MPSLTGQVAIVTGGGRGIGRAIALELAKEGAAVVVTARTQAEVVEVADRIKASGGKALAMPIDVGSLQEVQHLVEATETTFGPVDILVNNAAIRGPVAFIQNVEPDDFMDVFRINVGGTFQCARAVLPGMITRRKGRIINFSGGGAWTGIRGGGPYGASKSAVEGLTRTIAQEAQRFGVTCNAIQPGRVDTQTFPILEVERQGPIVGPDHAARCIAWLCTDEAKDVTGLTINAVEWDRRHSAGEDPHAAIEASSTRGPERGSGG
jgi:NAD(P)-dependent dehydrogenase (short-subunit alcohol dehydrogenase family)